MFCLSHSKYHEEYNQQYNSTQIINELTGAFELALGMV